VEPVKAAAPEHEDEQKQIKPSHHVIQSQDFHQMDPSGSRFKKLNIKQEMIMHNKEEEEEKESSFLLQRQSIQRTQSDSVDRSIPSINSLSHTDRRQIISIKKNNFSHNGILCGGQGAGFGRIS